MCKSIFLGWSSLMLKVWCLTGNDTDMFDNRVTRGRIELKIPGLGEKISNQLEAPRATWG